METHSPHGSKVPFRDAGCIGCKIRRFKTAPLLYLLNRWQFIEDHVPLTAQINRRQHLPEFRSRGHVCFFPHFLCHIRSDEINQSAHLTDPILDRCSGHEQDSCAFIFKSSNILGPLCVRILNIVCLVNDQHIKVHDLVDPVDNLAHRLIIGDSTARTLPPVFE